MSGADQRLVGLSPEAFGAAFRSPSPWPALALAAFLLFVVMEARHRRDP